MSGTGIDAGPGGTDADALPAGTTVDGWQAFFPATDLVLYGHGQALFDATDMFVSADGQIFASYNQLWRSSNDGKSWTMVNGTAAFSIGQTGDNSLYGLVPTGTGTAAVRSMNGGTTWQSWSIPSIDGNTPDTLATAEGQPMTVYLGYQNGIAITRDGGATWEQIPLPAGAEQLPPSKLLVDSHGTIYLLRDTTILRRHPTGLRWSTFSLTGSFHSARRFADDTMIVATSLGVFRSLDFGDTWLPVDGAPMVREFQLSSAGLLFASVGSSVFGSDDQGLSWRSIGPVHDPAYDLVGFVALHDGRIFASQQGNLVDSLLSPPIDWPLNPPPAPSPRAATCYDATLDGDETDVDCGGSCGLCP